MDDEDDNDGADFSRVSSSDRFEGTRPILCRENDLVVEWFGNEQLPNLAIGYLLLAIGYLKTRVSAGFDSCEAVRRPQACGQNHRHSAK